MKLSVILLSSMLALAGGANAQSGKKIINSKPQADTTKVSERKPEKKTKKIPKKKIKKETPVKLDANYCPPCGME